MKHPYNVAYLQEVAETQGDLFERLQDAEPEVDGLEFIRSYMKSDTRRFIDKGDAYLATLGSRDLMDYYRAEDACETKPGPPLRGFIPNWIGQFYANYQWQTNGLSSDIVDRIPPDWLATAYSGLHDLDMRLAVEKVAAQVGDVCDANAMSSVAEGGGEYDACPPTPSPAP